MECRHGFYRVPRWVVLAYLACALDGVCEDLTFGVGVGGTALQGLAAASHFLYPGFSFNHPWGISVHILLTVS